ncbi:MAG: DUF2163 domain-containing protein [Victivallaceae bacterium]|nr:DUF2163 domain-containing protein [Victivallaceae bacterium]
MITLSAAQQAFFDGPTVTKAFLITITRVDGEVFRFTTHDENLSLGSDIFYAGFISLSKIMMSASLEPDSVDIAIIMDPDHITEADVTRKRMTNAAIEIRICDYTDTSTNLIYFSGTTSGIVADEGIAKFEGRSRRRLLQRTITNQYSPGCRARLGDAKCGIDLDGKDTSGYPIIVTGRLVNTVYSNTEFTANIVKASEDGTIKPIDYTATTISTTAPAGDEHGYFDDSASWSTHVFQTGQVITVSGFTNDACNGKWRITNKVGSKLFVIGLSQGKANLPTQSASDSVAIVVDASYVPSGHYSHGKIIWTRGRNTGFISDIRKYWIDGSLGRFKLLAPPPFKPIQGDQITIIAGCDGRRGTCLNKFNNVINFQGEPDLPGIDNVSRYPDHAPVEVDLN